MVALTPRTEYTVTTALAILALLDVHDALEQSERHVDFRRELILAAEEASRSFLGGRYDLVGDRVVFWYSVLETDRYHVINVISLFAGAIQRLAQALSGQEGGKASTSGRRGCSVCAKSPLDR
jgi:hypothetical protein